MTERTSISKNLCNLVLIIEDDELLGDITKNIIEKIGYGAIWVKDRDDALDWILNHYRMKDLVEEPLLILMDIYMNGMSVDDFILQLQRYNLKFPVVFTSGAKSEDVMKIIKGYAGQFLAKPYNLHEIKKALLKAEVIGNNIIEHQVIHARRKIEV